MKMITITPDDLKAIIEKHFASKGLKAELYTTMIAQSGSKIQNVRFEGVFNSIRILEVDIYFNGQYEPIITGFKGICPMSELTNILTELEVVINSL